MFTVKVFRRGGHSRHAYEARQYSVDEAENMVTFQEPTRNTPTTVCLGCVYERIVVENVAGKTIENMTHHPGVSEEQLPDVK